MFWCDEVVQGISGPQTVNDSKTPSGRVHVGSLRGVLIHDAVYRTLKERGVPTRYMFGVDDYDPLDELPAGQAAYFEQYLGVPLCNVPAPSGSSASDMAEHYISEFFDVFRVLGVQAQTYRMRDIYRSGQFNQVIDSILQNAATVRRVYKEVSNAYRPETWYPFQVICENCGRIGTTEVSAYDGKEVTYDCRPDLVTWARGCGYHGKVSPFDGRGKLPWKLEWVGKWRTFPVTIEGAGKDHTTKGGSRDVAGECLRAIFGQEPPLNIPYEFFLVEGSKMSSSRGVGVSAREMADFLPPEILRFLMIRAQPNRTVNFSPAKDQIVKLFNDFDRLHWKVYNDPKVADEEKRTYFLSETEPKGNCYIVNFQLVLALIQLPHINIFQEIEKRKGSPLTDVELHHLKRRMEAAQYWLNHYAEEEDKIRLQETLPSRAQELTDTQRAFLHLLAATLGEARWEEDVLQVKIFDAARQTPISQAKAFEAIYRVLLDHSSGPKAGSLLAVLDPSFVIKRCSELPYSKTKFWTETGITDEEFDRWLGEHRKQIRSITALCRSEASETNSTPNDVSNNLLRGAGVIEFLVTLTDDRVHMKRVLYQQVEGFDTQVETEVDYLATYSSGYIHGLEQKHQLPIVLDSGPCESVL